MHVDRSYMQDDTTVVTQKQWKWRGDNSTVWSNSKSEYKIRQDRKCTDNITL